MGTVILGKDKELCCKVNLTILEGNVKAVMSVLGFDRLRTAEHFRHFQRFNTRQPFNKSVGFSLYRST
jgi:hypothetical protein